MKSKDILRSIYHWSRPTMIRLGPSNTLVKIWGGIIMNAMCRSHNTKMFFGETTFEIHKGEKLMKLNKNHWVYGPALSSSFEAYFDCVVPHAEEGKLVVDYSRPRLQKFTTTGLNFELSSFTDGEDCVEDYFTWYQPKTGDSVFDIGANCGLASYHLSRMVGSQGKVFAFEPDPINYQILVRNIELHKLKNVIPLQKAIAPESGNLKFCSEGTTGSVLAQHLNRPTTGSLKIVEAITLAEAFRDHGVPDFIKMDIEGAEIEVLAASQAVLQKHAVPIALDTNHFRNGVMTNKPVEIILRNYGYEVLSSTFKSGFLTTVASKNSSHLVTI